MNYKIFTFFFNAIFFKVCLVYILNRIKTLIATSISNQRRKIIKLKPNFSTWFSIQPLGARKNSRKDNMAVSALKQITRPADILLPAPCKFTVNDQPHSKYPTQKDCFFNNLRIYIFVLQYANSSLVPLNAFIGACNQELPVHREIGIDHGLKNTLTVGLLNQY